MGFRNGGCVLKTFFGQSSCLCLTSDPWKTDAYRRNHSLLLQLDMGKFRSKAYDAHFIDDEEMGELASQAGTRQSHNEKLLEIGKGPGGVRTFRHLVKTVGLFGERYEEMREELEEVLKTAEGKSSQKLCMTILI